MGHINTQWTRFLRWLRHGQMPRWILLGFVVGLFSGIAATLFFYALETAKWFAFDYLAAHPLPSPTGERVIHWETHGQPRAWLYFLLPAIGGLISGILVYTLAPEAEGHGADAMIDAFHNQAGKIRGRVVPIKALTTIVTLASGGSAGREGPIAQIGAGIGSYLATLLKLPVRDRRILLLAGTGGGLGAIFRAPLGGAITAMEVIYREDLETDALIPTVISSITAYTLFKYVLYTFSGIEGPIFTISHASFTDPRQLIFYVILGLVCVPIGVFYIRAFYFLRDNVFRPLPIPNHVKPMLGGLLVGAIGLALYKLSGGVGAYIFSGGWGWIQAALLGRVDLLPLKIMALVVVFKILATCFTISSGGSGGVFGPTLFIGAMIGGVVGFLSQEYFPHIVPDGRAFILVGMASFFAGVAHAPLGALLMVTEMTAGYELIAPLLLVSVIAMIFNRRWSIYQKQVTNKFSSPAHAGDFTVNVLEDMKVSSIFRPLPTMHQIPARATLDQVQYYLSQEDSEILPVVKDDGEIIGVISLDTAKPILFEENVEQFLIAADMAIPASHVHPDDSLYQALIEFLKFPVSGILVTDKQDPQKILGILRHRDLISAYNNEIVKRKAA